MAKPEIKLAETAGSGTLSFEQRDGGELVVRLSGPWSLRGGLPSIAEVAQRLGSAGRVSIDRAS